MAKLLAAAQMSKHCRLENLTQVKIEIFCCDARSKQSAYTSWAIPSQRNGFKPPKYNFMVLEEEAKWHAGMEFKNYLPDQVMTMQTAQHLLCPILVA